ncbi:MAG: IPT/TIG domain-containing protein [Acidimicrobiales bacterium]
MVITGSDLANASAVDFGGIPATITVDSTTSITATSPPGTGTVDITVTTPDGTSAISTADQYSYALSVPPPTLSAVSPAGGPVTGGTSVTVTGDNLGGATAVDFGPGNPGSITADSSTSVTATSPAGTGTVDVTVTTPSGTTVPSQPDQFTFGTPVLTKLSSWTDSQACGVSSTTSVPSLASTATLTAVGGVGGGGGGALYSTSGGAGGVASSVTGTVPVTGGQHLTAVTGCAGATAPDDADVAATGGAGGVGFSNGGAGGDGYYCLGANIEGECVGEGGADGSGGGGGGSSAVCSGTSCEAGVTPLVVAGGGGGGGESTLSGSDGGAGGAAGSGSSTSSADPSGAGPSGATGATGATDIDAGNTGGAGGVNSTGDSAGGGAGGNGLDTVSAGESAANGGGGGGYVGGAGSTDDTAEDGGSGGGGGGGSSWIVNNAGATFATTSAAAAVTVDFYGFVGSVPSVTTQPTGQTVDAGKPATFTAAGSGNPAPAVQWQVSTDGGTTFADLLGATSTTYTVTAEPSESGNQYRALFTNSVGAVDTDPAALTVDSLPVVTTNPASESVNEGLPATFTAAGHGTPAPTVQWQVSTDGGTTFTNIPGATSSTYSFTTVAGDNGNQYQAAFTNIVGTVDSTPATLTLRTLPVVTTEPAGDAVHERAVATFTAAATSYPTPSVQWQVSTNGGTTFSAIAKATATTYSFTTSAAENHRRYRAVFTNAVGSATTTPATLTVTAAVPVKITTTTLHAGSVYKKTKSAYSATLKASGGIAPYRWSLKSGKLPRGLTLSSTGVISGKATTAGTETFVVKVVDTKSAVTPPTSATKKLSITIN